MLVPVLHFTINQILHRGAKLWNELENKFKVKYT